LRNVADASRVFLFLTSFVARINVDTLGERVIAGAPDVVSLGD